MNILSIIKNQLIRFQSYLQSFRFRHCGKQCVFPGFNRLIGSQFICIGDNTKIGRHATLTAWDKVGGKKFHPSITIGTSCNIGEYCNITCINKIILGNGVLTGRWVTISDNNHGETSYIDLQKPPLKRKVISKGPVIIGDNVWIGDKATILSNVSIGEGSVIAANTVVTKDVPSYCIVAGNPGVIIKKINYE